MDNHGPNKVSLNLARAGTSMSTPHEFKRDLDIVGSGLVDLKPFVTHGFKLEEGLDAFATAMRRDSLKVVLMPRGDL